MIDRIVSFALSQRFMVLVAMIALGIWGVVSFQNLPIDAYPDLAPPRVQIVSQWPGHAAEEVERQITIPLETEMNGIPKLDALRASTQKRPRAANTEVQREARAPPTIDRAGASALG